MNKRFIIMLVLIVTLPISLGYFYFPTPKKQSGTLEAWKRDFNRKRNSRTNSKTSKKLPNKLRKSADLPEYQSFVAAASDDNCGEVYLCYVPQHPMQEFAEIRFEPDNKKAVKKMLSALIRPLYFNLYAKEYERITEQFFSLDDRDYYLYLARYHSTKNSFGEAHNMYSKYIDNFNQSDTEWFEVAEFYYKFNKFRQALAMYEKAKDKQHNRLSKQELDLAQRRIQEIKDTF